MRSPIVIGVTVLMIGAAAAGCARRERVTIVNPPPATVITPAPTVVTPPPAVVATPAPTTSTVVIADPPRFREYVLTQNVPSYTYQGEIVIGAVLPPAGVMLYQIPPQFGAMQYRYAMVNNRLVLVDPATNRIVQIIG